MGAVQLIRGVPALGPQTQAAWPPPRPRVGWRMASATPRDETPMQTSAPKPPMALQGPVGTHMCPLQLCPHLDGSPTSPTGTQQMGKAEPPGCSASPSAPGATCTEWVWVPGRDRGCRGHQSPVGRTEVHRALVPSAAQHRAVPTPIWLLGMCSITRPWVLGTVSAPACPYQGVSAPA